MRGRFAPTPSGPLHAGSLVAAIGSWLDARAHRGAWLVRIDDVDQPRTAAGAERLILDELSRLGLEPDEPPVAQRHRTGAYASALATLRAQGDCFDCGCSRREVAGGPYPGTCANGLPAGREARTVRMRIGNGLTAFDDVRLGAVRQDLTRTFGAFIIRRADQIHAYHLAAVVDDAAAGITHVVRGADLLESTGAQVLLQSRLGLDRPMYHHLPVVTDGAGRKLSKQHHAPPTAGRPVVGLWRDTLTFLGFDPPPWPDHTPLERVQRWALEVWAARHAIRPPVG